MNFRQMTIYKSHKDIQDSLLKCRELINCNVINSISVQKNIIFNVGLTLNGTKI